MFYDTAFYGRKENLEAYIFNLEFYESGWRLYFGNFPFMFA